MDRDVVAFARILSEYMREIREHLRASFPGSEVKNPRYNLFDCGWVSEASRVPYESLEGIKPILRRARVIGIPLAVSPKPTVYSQS